MRKKFIFVTGGVLSSLGKGVSGAAIGTLLVARGIRVTNVKMDPYLNVDPGTMNPYQHGEVFVTDDGAETDLDLGHYERFTDIDMHRRNNFTTGNIYQNVIARERQGEYLGRTVQVIPHITDEIKRLIWNAAKDVDLAIIEVGGTVGDIESLPFLEAIRQFRTDAGRDNVLFLHLTLVPYIKSSGELKTKPTQHSVKGLLQIGIQPDIILCRTDRPLPKSIREKISLFCNVEVDEVIAAQDVKNIYELPSAFHEEGLDDRVLEKLGIWAAKPRMEAWQDYLARASSALAPVRIGVVGKYVHLVDSYKSLNEALAHASVGNDAVLELVYIDAEALEPVNLLESLERVDGVLVPGGFGERGMEGKIRAITFAREAGRPFLGICLGMQLAVVEFARNVLKWSDACSREQSITSAHTVVELMNEQRTITDKGGTMRLGAWPCCLASGTLARRLYDRERIQERHRHRLEVNPLHVKDLEQGGLQICGTSPDGKLVEMIEITEHPFFLGCQFHPEFKSRPLSPHPVFLGFIAASVAFRRTRGKSDIHG